jgi:type I restriction enzyme, S subunit
MSSKGKSPAVAGGGAPLVPKLRFPEFQDAPAWKPVSLRKASVPVEERVGERKLTPVSISAGIGFVPQAEKFGRDISGNQYQRYTLVRDGDFVFNKGNSLKFPQGCIYLLEGWGEVAAPNVFIAFRLKEGYSNGFFQNCFEQNQHGQQLKRHITSGARSNGLLNISKETFFNVAIPTPSLPEQQKIADCLDSADALIAAQGRKVEALKAHKKGLMQQLFPQEGETQPRLRFPEFEGVGEWEFIELGKLLRASPDYGVSAAAVQYDEDLPKYLRITDISEDGRYLEGNKVSVDVVPSAGDYLDEGDIAIARTGASVGKSYRYRREDGKLVFAGFLIRLRPDQRKLMTEYLAHYLTTPQYWDWISVNSARSGQPGINSSELSSLPVPLPADGRQLREQQRIADCLTSLDDLITAETKKLHTLKTHKKGLMQQLFPMLGGADA